MFIICAAHLQFRKIGLHLEHYVEFIIIYTGLNESLVYGWAQPDSTSKSTIPSVPVGYVGLT